LKIEDGKRKTENGKTKNEKRKTKNEKRKTKTVAKTKRFDTKEDIEAKIAELDQDLSDLAQDENALEIQILGLLLNGAHVAQDVETFVSFDFYEHETVVTPVFSGLRISLSSPFPLYHPSFAFHTISHYCF
jgi:First C2 domain of RPGR-interacting protein 1